MQCAERFSNSATSHLLNQSQLIALLSLPDAEETEKSIAEKAKERQLAELKQNTVTDKCPERSEELTEVTPKEKRQAERENTTNFQLAKMAGVSDKTVQRYKKIKANAQTFWRILQKVLR